MLYARFGWPVLPLVPQRKNPLTVRGLLSATTDETIINAWWSHWPSANIGLRTGIAFDVLDIDGDVGRESLASLLGPDYQHTGPISHTGRGTHWLFLPNNSANRANMLPKLDWRGVNGYIVAPPSIHPEGHKYEWDIAHSFATTLPAIPDRLVGLMVDYKEPVEYPHIIPDPNNPLNDLLTAALDRGLAPRPRGGGNRYVLNCIFHEGDREASLTLYPDQHFFCYGCGAWGNAHDMRAGIPAGKK